MPDKNRLHIDIPLILIALLAVFLNGYSIWTDQYANTYYTTAVGSMLQNFHNFFFASLDSAGSVTVDKPPLTFWIQTISAYIFGLHGWSVILPQALAGVGSVLIMYRLIKPTFGLTAARFAALVMASTPVAAAVSRTNNIDSMLVFALLLGALLLFRSVKRNSVWSLLGAFAMIGLAFNMKMLQAYMVLPTFYLFYLLAAKITWKRKIGLLAGATAIMLVISLSWAVVVDSIPQDKRPYIGSSQSNSVLELAFGYNGIARLTGNQGHGGAAPLSGRSADAGNGDGGGQAGRDRLGDGGMPGGGMGGMFGTGQKGILRLFQAELSGQASWLLPFAAFGCIGLFAGWRRRNFTQKHKEALFWIAWLVPGMVFFSIAGFFHPYYLIMLAPPIAGLVGAGRAELWHSYRERMNWQSWLLPLAIAATSLLAWHIIRPYDTVIGGWSWAIAAGGMTAASLLPVLNNRSGKLARTAIALGLLAMFAGPLYWAATPITYGQSSMLPESGPGTLNGQGGMFPPGMNGNMARRSPGMGMEQGLNTDAKTLAYLKEHNTGEKYLFAATDYNTAAPYIINEGESVIIMSGFSGSDPVYSVDRLKALVEKGELKYFMISGGGFGGRGGSSQLTEWIKQHGKEIPSAQWQSTEAGSSGNAFGGRGGGTMLYEVNLVQAGESQ